MSRNSVILIVGAILLVAIVGVSLYILLRPKEIMTGGPGMVYFFSPT
jgi:hypothetical protein